MLTSLKASSFLWIILFRLRRTMFVVAVYVLLICWLDNEFQLETLKFPVGLITVFGTVVSLLITFRTNSSYSRWWEARILWGAIVNDSRSWTRQLLSLTKNADRETIQKMSWRQIAWCFALSRSLRKQDAFQDLDSLIEPDELATYRKVLNVPNAILRRQAEDLRELHQAGHLETYSFIELERTLVRLTNHMGGCERIKNTPFPVSYSLMVHLAVYIFVVMLPFGLVDTPPLALAALSISIAFAFLTIESVAIFLQDPFSGSASDTPTLALSRTIEINLRQMLEEADVPDVMQPVNGQLD
ncbi:MAG: bestrophin family ion channel [Planctomycetota bacterium]